MPALLKLLLTVSASLLAVVAHARTWTSTDGRTIEATLVSKGEDFVVLRLDATGGTVTVKHSLLSADDVEYAKKVEPARVSTDNIDTIINKYPVLAFKDENGKQLNEKYFGFAKIMTPATAFNVAQMMRKKLPEDLKYWKEQSERVPPKVKPPARKQGETAMDLINDWRAKTAKQNEAYQNSKDYYKWLSETLPAWLAEVEKAASQ